MSAILRAIERVERREIDHARFAELQRELAERLYDKKREAMVAYGFPSEVVDYYFPPRVKR